MNKIDISETLKKAADDLPDLNFTKAGVLKTPMKPLPVVLDKLLEHVPEALRKLFK